MKTLRISILLAALLGVINSLVWYLLALKMGFYSDYYYGYRLIIMYAFLLIGTFLTIYISKKKNNGFIEFKECLRLGIMFSLGLAFILAIFNFIYHTYITPDTVDYFCSVVKKAGVAHHKSPAEIDQYIEIQKKALSSYRLYPPALFGGLVFSLLAGAILQKSEVKNP